MAEVFHVFDELLSAEGETYRAQVCGRPAERIWEGWIEFIHTREGYVLRSPRETTQPDRIALSYWATGLSPTYLEGALARAMAPPLRLSPPVAAAPYFDGPAPSVVIEPVPVDERMVDPGAAVEDAEQLLRLERRARRRSRRAGG